MHDKLNLHTYVILRPLKFALELPSILDTFFVFQLATCETTAKASGMRRKQNQFWAEDVSQVGQEGWENYGILLLGSFGGDDCGLDVRKPYSVTHACGFLGAKHCESQQNAWRKV